MALKSDKPYEVYQEARKSAQDLQEAPKIEELPKARRDWLYQT